MSTVIKPTIGRVVWYYYKPKQDQPMAAVISWVHTDKLVNLTVSDKGRHMSGSLEIPLVQANEEIPGDPYCTWMPYQIGQAKKAEELQAKVDEDKKEA